MVSAVILSYNRCVEVLKTVGMLKELRKSLPFEMEIVVVDNASVDDTSKQLDLLHPDIILITKAQNNGIAGWNEGFKVAKHKYFLVLDDDSHVHSGLAEAIVHLENHPEIGILAMKIVTQELKMDVFLADEDAWKDGDAVSGFIGCGAIIRKELYEKIGGYAEWIYLYTHEFEYGIRCLNAGYEIRFFGNGIVVHRVSKINRIPKNMRIYGTRNEMEIVNKYFTYGKTKYLLRTLFNNLKFIKREGLRSALYVLQGAFQFLKLRNQVPLTPVKVAVQEFYVNQFWSTKPVFLFVRRRVSRLTGQKN